MFDNKGVCDYIFRLAKFEQVNKENQTKKKHTQFDNERKKLLLSTQQKMMFMLGYIENTYNLHITTGNLRDSFLLLHFGLRSTQSNVEYHIKVPFKKAQELRLSILALALALFANM